MTHCENCNRFHCGQCLKKDGNSKFEKKQKKRDDKEDWKGKKKARPSEQTHATYEGSDNDTEGVTYDSQTGEYLGWYDWLGNTCTTSHVVNHKNAFMNYQPLKWKQVRGVGNLVTQAEGQGTIQIELNIDGKKYISTLNNVLYIPTN